MVFCAMKHEKLTYQGMIFQNESLEKSMIFIRTNERTNERTLVLNTICPSREAASAVRACGTVFPPVGTAVPQALFLCKYAKTIRLCRKMQKLKDANMQKWCRRHQIG